MLAPMPRIYTRTGDDGSTGLLYGGRVSKSDPATEAYGTTAAGKIDKFRGGMFFPSQLDKVDISLNHRLGDALSISNADISEIEDTVEPAIA